VRSVRWVALLALPVVFAGCSTVTSGHPEAQSPPVQIGLPTTAPATTATTLKPATITPLATPETTEHDVTVQLTATQSDGSQQRFEGTFTVANRIITAARLKPTR